MLEIVLSKSQTKSWEGLLAALEILEQSYNDTTKFNYDSRYKNLLLSEVEYRKFEDKVTGKIIDLSIDIPRFDTSDVEVLDGINHSMSQIQARRDRISKERIRSIQNLAKWRTMYYSVRALEDQMEGFWMTVDEIKRLKSKELREAEIGLRTKVIASLRRRVEVYFKEGKHRDQGEAISYEVAVKEELDNLDSKRDVVSRKFGIFGAMRGK